MSDLGNDCFVCGRIGKAVGEIRAGDGTVLAEAELILADMPAEMLVDVDLKRLGWRVDV